MKNIFEVSSLLVNLNSLIDQNVYLKDIWIQGEVTDYKGPAYSGHSVRPSTEVGSTNRLA